ncbi:ABC transporter permease [Oleiagrimonas citrea]|uniref:FtsX-like permease family protein n=1 Tax=Oleiagrimonas citrea TaxID=1665687 RepID=A0A846ZNN2_9GAMM|nr:FtsX-like permease family protein [Oleiagrimonas citrea]
MFAYYLDLALHSLKLNKSLTALMVLLVGVGVAGSMVTFEALRVATGDPMPGRSAHLFVPQIDNQGPSNREDGDEPPWTLSYLDTRALLKAREAQRQAAVYAIRLPLVPADATRAPFTVKGEAVTPDFFPMFGVSFVYGGSWDQADANQGTHALVISRQLNDRLFSGRNSVGREIRLGKQVYRVVGVSRYWNPQPRFYSGSNINDLRNQGAEPDFFLPFSTAIAAKIESAGNVSCKPDYKGDGWGALLRSECDWIAVWVQLPNAIGVRGYHAFLHNYAAAQQRMGRFQWAPDVRLRNLTQWLDYVHAVPSETRVSFLFAVALLLVCLFNTTGLLLAKFMRRSGEIGVRRALGASHGAIYTQFLIEAMVIGMAGSLLGVLLTVLGVSGMGLVFQPKIARFVHVDTRLLGLTVLVSLVTILVAAIYPVWRAAQVQPAWQLKSG